jgi:hypothetical protein
MKDLLVRAVILSDEKLPLVPRRTYLKPRIRIDKEYSLEIEWERVDFSLDDEKRTTLIFPHSEEQEDAWVFYPAEEDNPSNWNGEGSLIIK